MRRALAIAVLTVAYVYMRVLVWWCNNTKAGRRWACSRAWARYMDGAQ